jgi:hypothetical protein
LFLLFRIVLELRTSTLLGSGLRFLPQGRVPSVTWATTGLSPTDRFEEDPSRATVFETIGREMNKFLDELSCAARLYDFEPIVIRESRLSFLEHAPLRRDSSLLYEQRPVVVHAVRE